MNATAAAIFAHRHTVAYRLERVKELTGLDPTQSEDRERLGLGLKAYRIIAPSLPNAEAAAAPSRKARRATADGVAVAATTSPVFGSTTVSRGRRLMRTVTLPSVRPLPWYDDGLGLAVEAGGDLVAARVWVPGRTAVTCQRERAASAPGGTLPSRPGPT